MSFSPNDTFDYELAGGRILVCRYGSLGEWNRYEADHQKIVNDKEAETANRLSELIARFAVGGVDVVRNTLTHGEVFEVAANLPLRSVMTELEKKRSLSPSPTDAATSAPDAKPASA